MQTYDYVIKGAKVFDGSTTVKQEDIAISDGKIAARGNNVEVSADTKVIDGSGKWAMPGLFDIHTHYDLELEVAPGLPESIRHGTTTVVIANCSLGLAYGAQRKDGADPIVDCYARVENIPKTVLSATGDLVTWNTPQEYLEHLDSINLGPNVVPLLPHSMMRIEAMGLEDSVSRDPTEQELAQMKDMLAEGLDLGYAGFSTDALPFHYLANQPNTHKTIPTQFAKYSELKALTSIVREKEKLWQATPPKDSPLNVFKIFMLTSGRLYGKPLKTTVVAALDVHSNRMLVKMARTLAKILNSSLVKGKFHMQALAAPFKIWADGVISPLSEEIPELRRLVECDLEDKEGRQAIMNDPAFVADFKKMWMEGKTGFGPARLKRWLRMEQYAFNRDLADMTVDRCPMTKWQGMSFASVYAIVLAANMGNTARLSEEELTLIKADFAWVQDEADFMLQMLRSFDTDLSWSTVTANRDPHAVRELLMDPLLLPGFNDSGAHLTNMAFYDVNLRALKLASQGGDSDIAYMVKRLTKDAAEVFGVSGGTIEVGDQADVILVDPGQLAAYESEDHTQRIYREEFKCEQLVNRSDNVVPMVMVNGQLAWQGDDFTPELGKQKMGELKRA